MTRIVTLETHGPARQVAGLFVVGIHGTLDDRKTPARCAPVHAFDGKLAAIDPRDLEGSASVRVEISDEPVTDPLPGDGTRLDSWPARLAWVLVALGARERDAAPPIKDHVVRSGTAAAGAVRLLDWLASGNAALRPEYACERGTGIVWYAQAPDVAALWRGIEAVARQAWIGAIGSPQPSRLETASFYLSRAALAAESVYWAAAGLRDAGVDAWELVLSAGTPGSTPHEREAGLHQAQAQLDARRRFPDASELRKRARHEQMAPSQRQQAVEPRAA